MLGASFSGRQAITSFPRCPRLVRFLINFGCDGAASRMAESSLTAILRYTIQSVGMIRGRRALKQAAQLVCLFHCESGYWCRLPRLTPLLFTAQDRRSTLPATDLEGRP